MNEERDKIIIRTSVAGIFANVFLAAFKAVVGILSHSIAITLDAVNNLSDALSSIITIAGTKLAAKAPDKKHPLGYGRVEYLSAMIISVLVLYAGIQSLVESVKKIIHPQAPDYGMAALIIVAAAVVVKILLGTFFIKKGKEASSESLGNSGKDAKNDSILSLSTLVAALIFIFTGVSIEAYLGVVISAVIIKAGIDMLKDTINEVLGERVDADTARKVKEIVSSFEGVDGAYDLLVHNYGPERMVGSVHIEIPDYYTAAQIDTLTREITMKVYEETRVILTGISVYAQNTGDDEAARIEAQVVKIAKEDPYVLQTHGFYMVPEKKHLQIDTVISFDAPDRAAECQKIRDKIQEAFPDYQVFVQMDSDTSD